MCGNGFLPCDFSVNLILLLTACDLPIHSALEYPENLSAIETIVGVLIAGLCWKVVGKLKMVGVYNVNCESV